MRRVAQVQHASDEDVDMIEEMYRYYCIKGYRDLMIQERKTT